ncbi:MAG: hypothetical protein Q8O00_11230 [Holophaga sp.]|nr:hypothetical protein [Holophaga sp.]
MAKRYDNATWEQIREEYRAGALSVRDIAKAFGPTEAAIRLRAKKDGWERDLSDQVRAATRAKLDRSVATPGAPPSEIIEAASARNFTTLQGHIKRLGKLAEFEDQLIERLEQGLADMDRVGEAEGILGRLESLAGIESPKAMQMAVAALFNPEELRSELMKKLTRCYSDITAAAAKRIQLERQALNMDKPEDTDKQLSGFVFQAHFDGEADHA